MKIKNRTWVLYNNKPHFVISCYPEETRLHTLDEKRITVPTKDLSTMVVPTFIRNGRLFEVTYDGIPLDPREYGFERIQYVLEKAVQL